MNRPKNPRSSRSPCQQDRGRGSHPAPGVRGEGTARECAGRGRRTHPGDHREGGRKLIQVVDDGSGMDEQDALASFLRHATSKIASYADLEAIRTFGFRGEALASIGAVARVTMKTRRARGRSRRRREDRGRRAPPDVSREGREPGTSIAVQNLFFNVPARLKFLKSGNTEFRHVYDAVQHVALSYPEIALDFISDDDTIFHLAPCIASGAAARVFGERQFSVPDSCGGGADFLKVHGYLGKPSFGQKSRAHQYLFLNRRFIVNRNVNHAVYLGV